MSAQTPRSPWPHRAGRWEGRNLMELVGKLSPPNPSLSEKGFPQSRLSMTLASLGQKGTKKGRLEERIRILKFESFEINSAMFDSISLYLLCSIIAWKHLHVSHCDTIPSHQGTQSASETCNKNAGSGCRFD